MEILKDMLTSHFYYIQRRAEQLRTVTGSTATIDIYGVKTHPITGEILTQPKLIIKMCSPYTLDTARNTATRNGYTISGIIARGAFRTPAGITDKITLY